jgi:hypothetical protein
MLNSVSGALVKHTNKKKIILKFVHSIRENVKKLPLQY